MKSLILSTYDVRGGAARAAQRLHQGLQKIGLNSEMLVQFKSTTSPSVLATANTELGRKLVDFRSLFDAIPLLFYPECNRAIYSSQLLPDRVMSQVAKLNPDVINLHWICGGYVSIETIGKFKKPLVWTLHDMWPFTGGCHYSLDCQRYKNSCGACPQLSSSQKWDLSNFIWHRKALAWKSIKKLIIVTPSKWLAECAASSSLFNKVPVKVIPYGIDTDVYKPIPQKLARQILNISPEKKVILFGAMGTSKDSRKGLYFLEETLKKLSLTPFKNEIELVFFGSVNSTKQANWSFKTHYLGQLTDDLSLAIAYAAANTFVAPSVQDNLPLTVMEALSCGTPCVAFNIGGMPDLIEHKQNGYLAKPFEIDDLTQGINWVMSNSDDDYHKLQEKCRQKVEKEFSLELQARRYEILYSELLENQNYL